MAEKLDQDQLVSFRELLLANSMQIDALTQLFIEKGITTDDEFYTKLKQVQMEYQRKNGEIQ